MKISLLSPHATGHHPQWTCFLARYLVENGDSVTIYSTGPHDSWNQIKEFAPIAKIEYLGPPKESRRRQAYVERLNYASVLRKFLARSANEKADIVHNLYMDWHVFEHFLVFAKLSLPYKFFTNLFWPYFMTYDNEQKRLSRKIFHGFEKRLLKSLLLSRRLERVFVLRNSFKKQLVNSLGRECEDLITAVPDPVFKQPERSAQDAKEKLGIPSELPVIGFFGRMSKEKGFDIFLEALQHIQGDYIALVTGPAGHFGNNEINALRNRLNLNGRLICNTNYVPSEFFQQSILATDLVIMPYRSVFKGPSGVLQDAAAAGKPIICSDVNEIGRTVRENGLGVLFQPESPLALAEAIDHALASKKQIIDVTGPCIREYCVRNDSLLTAKLIREEYERSLQKS